MSRTPVDDVDTLSVELQVRVNELAPEAVASQQMGQLILERCNEGNLSQQIRQRLGLPQEFEVRVALAEPTAAAPQAVAPPDFETLAQDCVEGTQYSWSKGCSSWPW